MKNLFRLLTLVLAVAACEQDVYDKGDNALSYMRADFVEAVVGSDKQVSYVLTDADERLPLTAAYTAKWIERPDTVYRAVLYYNYTDQKAEVLNLSRVSTVAVRPQKQFKNGVQTDPLGLESVWMSTNKRYLNLSVIIKTGSVSEDAEIQTLGMVGDTIMVGDDGLRTYQLRLFHSQGDVPQYYSQRLYFCVPLSDLPVDSLQLSVNTYDGIVTKGFRLLQE